MSEKQRILDMIEAGKITATEAMELLEAMDKVEPDKSLVTKSVGKFKTLKVLVEAEKDNTNVNINIPLELVKAVGAITRDLTKVIPQHAQDEMGRNGVDIGAIDIERIIQAIEDGTLENSTIIDVDVNNEKDGRVKVKVYVE